MILSEAFDQINNAYRGSDDEAPVSGPDYDLWLNTINRKISEYARDAKNTWQSNFEYNRPNEVGTVATTATTTLTGTGTYFTDYKVGDQITVSGETVRTIATIVSDTSLTVTVAFSNTASAKTFTLAGIIATGVQSYSLHRNFLMPSDKAFVSASQTLEYLIGKPQERARYSSEAYISGDNPKVLTFYSTIASTDSSVGGTLIVPGYYVPSALTASTDVIPVDDPFWVVMAVASELARNDLTYESKSVDLNNMANSLYSQMAQNNRRGSSNNPRVAYTNVQRIVGTEYGIGNS